MDKSGVKRIYELVHTPDRIRLLSVLIIEHLETEYPDLYKLPEGLSTQVSEAMADFYAYGFMQGVEKINSEGENA